MHPEPEAGSLSLGISALGDGEERALQPGDTLKSGARLALRLTVERPTYLYALYADAQGQVQRLFPEGSDQQVKPGTMSCPLRAGIEWISRPARRTFLASPARSPSGRRRWSSGVHGTRRHLSGWHERSTAGTGAGRGAAGRRVAGTDALRGEAGRGCASDRGPPRAGRPGPRGRRPRQRPGLCRGAAEDAGHGDLAFLCALTRPKQRPRHHPAQRPRRSSTTIETCRRRPRPKSWADTWCFRKSAKASGPRSSRWSAMRFRKPA